METADIAHEVLKSVRAVAERHGVHDINVSDHAAVVLVDAVARVSLSLAIAADPKVTCVVAHVGGDGKLAVSVRRGKHDWHEVVVDD